MELLSDSIPKRSKVIGTSVSEPLSSDLNVNFVCLSVMVRQLYRKSLPALILLVLRHVLIQKPFES